jgi:hypothetical protein
MPSLELTQREHELNDLADDFCQLVLEAVQELKKLEGGEVAARSISLRAAGLAGRAMCITGEID